MVQKSRSDLDYRRVVKGTLWNGGRRKKIVPTYQRDCVSWDAKPHQRNLELSIRIEKT